MKTIVMTTESATPVKMGQAGIFETGKAVTVADDALAGSLLKRSFPKFKEANAKSVSTKQQEVIENA
ncbi:MAG: hypothetical protein PHN84_14365 [Desulfuromonadaceae bacterium]|nr:hypothetical protein [Desulfuromonadaceae bacterium]MDD2855326.1 hypothetical protein [Desulfuromonadaceae bacterium]